MTTPPQQPRHSQQPQARTSEQRAPQASPERAQPQKLAMETKLVSRLQDSIDEHGRYAPRLKDLSVGFAAAKGVSEFEARQEIADLFQNQIGLSPQAYLENHRAERGLSVDSNNRDTDRGR